MAQMAVAPARSKSGRERILDAAYELFSRAGVRKVGVDSVIEEAGVAKMTLYRNFGSKDELALAFLERREELWTRAWLQGEVEKRAESPADRLLAIFDVFHDWFAREDFEGCAFITVLLESAGSPDAVSRASVRHLANIRTFLEELLRAAGVQAAPDVARQLHILMKGSIVAALEGDRMAARRAQEIARLLMEHHGCPPSYG